MADSSSIEQRLSYQPLLSFDVFGHVSAGRGGKPFASCIRQIELIIVVQNDSAYVVLAGIPRALVHGFLLTPNNVFDISKRGDDLPQVAFGKWVQLLQPNDCYIFRALVAALFQEIVVDLA